jgi:pyrroline-5-carboxylate reductase
MPNIPISSGNGSIIWYGVPNVNLSVNQKILGTLTSGPQSFWICEEHMINAATVISGCIPAYIAEFYQTYKELGLEMGFDSDITKRMLLNALYGTARLLEDMEPDELIIQVASKGGATERGLEMMRNGGFGFSIKESSFASLDRISNITKSLD